MKRCAGVEVGAHEHAVWSEAGVDLAGVHRREMAGGGSVMRNSNARARISGLPIRSSSGTASGLCRLWRILGRFTGSPWSAASALMI